jgi:hypothetical protein
LGTTDDDLASVGVLERLESPVPGGSPVYLNPANIPRWELETSPHWNIGEPTADYDENPDLARVQSVMRHVRMTAGRADALVTILEAFLEQDHNRRG